MSVWARHIGFLILLTLVMPGSVCILDTSVAWAEDAPITPKVSKKKKVRKKKKARKPQSISEKRKRRRSFENYLQNERVSERGIRMRTAGDTIDKNFDGSIRTEYRHFSSRALDPQSLNSNLSLLGEFETTFAYKKFEVKLWNLGRFDFNDSDRTRILPYENWVGYITDKFQVKLGMQIENWSMAEIFHPSDVFNSRNLDSELENTEKLGEPALSVRFGLLGGHLSAFYMPFFLSPVLPSVKSRLSAIPEAIPLLKTQFLHEGVLKENMDTANQFAVRYIRTFGVADIAVHFMDAIDRQEPLTALDMTAQGVRPVFLPVQQIGINGSVIPSESIFKFDVVKRKFKERLDHPDLGDIYQPDHTIASAGIEKSFHHASGAESVVLFEWQKIFDVTKDEARKFTLFQNDIMVGYRLAFNDLQTRELKAFAIIDLDSSKEYLWTFSYSQKLKHNVKINGGFRGISALSGTTQNLTDADHLFFNLTYFF